MGLRFGRVAGALALTGLLGLAGCGGSAIKATPPANMSASATPAVTVTRMAPAATGTSSPTQAPASPTIVATSRPTSPAVATTPTRSSAAPALILKVLEPADESVVTKSPVLVRGQTTAGAVVSVNASLADVDHGAGDFSALIPLEEGANLIEVVASDYAGNVLTQEILVVFEP